MSGTERPRIGVAGLGIMGSGMAANLLRKGFPVAVWNRTRKAADTLASLGAKVAPTPRSLSEQSDVVVTCLSTPTVVGSVATGHDGLLSGVRPGMKWIDTSTIGRPTALAMSEAAKKYGVEFLEAPVTGSKQGARDGTLVVMTGGAWETHLGCLPVLEAIGSKVIYVGPLGTAAVMKLIGNTVISFMLEGLAEGATLGARAGISIDKILEVVQASGFSSPYWTFKGGAMARRDFDPHFSINLLHKDQSLALAEAAWYRVPMPGLAAIHQVTATARALGYGHEDIAAQVKAVETLAGAPEGRSSERPSELP
jgi:3-hydroxyisobutyrate dehydrogenase-like beta-hydroxyacid dehydrogenase